MLIPEKIRLIATEWKAEGSVLYAAWVGHTRLPASHRNEEPWQQKLFLNNISCCETLTRVSRGELALATGVRGTASPNPLLRKLEDCPCAEVAITAHPALPCLSEVLRKTTTLRLFCYWVWKEQQVDLRFLPYGKEKEQLQELLPVSWCNFIRG